MIKRKGRPTTSLETNFKLVRQEPEENEADSSRAVFDKRIFEVVPKKLFCSSERGAQNKTALSEQGITHILSVNGCDPAFPESFQYKVLDLRDSSDEDLISALHESVDFIQTVLGANPQNRVLVHCYAGLSRSLSVVTGFLITTKRTGLEDALAQVKASRGGCEINRGFFEQLKEWEKIQLDPAK